MPIFSLSGMGGRSNLFATYAKGGNRDIPDTVVGGISALSISGLSQYLSLARQSQIHLYGDNQLPAWLSRLTLPMQFKGHRTRRLWSGKLLKNKNCIKEHKWATELPPVYFSCPEKAFLETLIEVPDRVTFEHADELMQGLMYLSPGKLDILLKECKSIKIKRLFFWLAKRQQHPWFSKININNYDLGSGNRVVAKGGKLDTELSITVPSHMTN